MLDAGAYIGMIIGFLSGVLTVRILVAISPQSNKGLAEISVLYAQIVLVPTLMFSGSWASSRLFENRWVELFDSYVRWLAISFFIVVFVPAMVWIINQIKRQLVTGGQGPEK
jgi:hypothetical protein